MSSTLQAALDAIRSHPDFRVLTRFQPIERYTDDSSDVRLGLVVDTETTGLEADADIIEIGMVLFSYSLSTKAIHAIVDTYSALEDPGYPIPETITQVTGITTDDVVGKAIDWSRVGALVDRAGVAIAHKADFDRPLLEKRSPQFAAIPWACSLNDINWAALGMGSSKLDYIAFRLGFFFEGHRAENDCRALLHVLTQTFPGAPAPLFEMMTRAAAQSSFRVWALGAPFDVKDTLKSHGYRWNDGADGRPKAWHKDVRDRALLVAEHDWLKKKAYPQSGGASLTIPVEVLTSKTRYSSRRGDSAPMAEILAPTPIPEPAPVAVPVPSAVMPGGQGSLWGGTDEGASISAPPRP